MISQTPQVSPRAREVGCPRCSAPLPSRAAECLLCHLPLVGPLAARLWTLDQQIDALGVVREEVLSALAASAAASTGPALTPPGGGRSPTAAAGPRQVPALPPPPPQAVPPRPPATSAEPDPRRRRLGVQQLLLVTGVVLVVAAAGVFTAAVWTAIGAVWQAVVLLAVCAAAAAASGVMARRALVASAEALAALAAGVLAVTLGSGRRLDLLGLSDVRVSVCLLGAIAAFALVCAGGDLLVPSTLPLVTPPLSSSPPVATPPVDAPAGAPAPPAVPRTFAWAAASATAALPTSLVVAVRGAALTWSAAALVLAITCVVVEPLARRRARALAATVLGIGAAHLIGAVMALLVVVMTDSRERYDLAAGAQFAALTAVAAMVARRTCSSRPAVAWLARRTAWTAAAGTVVSLAVTGTTLGLPLLAALLASASGVVVLTGARLAWPILLGAQALAGGALLVVPVVDAAGASAPSWACPPAWALLAASTWATARRRPVDPQAPALPPPLLAEAVAGWIAASAFATLLGAALIPGPLSRVARLVAVLVVGTGLLALAARVRRRGGVGEAVLVGGWALGVAIELGVAGAGGAAGREQVVLAVAGACALAYAVLPGRTLAGVAGTVLLSWAWWAHLTDLTPTPPDLAIEWWTLPPAVLALAVGAASWRRVPAASSWWVLGPGLLLGLAPSAVQASGSPTPWRPAMTLLAAVVVVAVGLRRSAQAPTVVGASAALVVGVGQLASLAAGAPLWASLGLSGLALLVLAIKVERARRDAHRVMTWLRALR